MLRKRALNEGHPLLARWLAHRLLPRRQDRILEGGCGLAGHVLRLHQAGYRVTGVDYAARTVEQVQRAFPRLDVREGDVRQLPFGDATFGLYLSFGVLEHFREGPDDALREAFRVIAPRGRLFATVPYFSPLRRVRAWLGAYDRPGARAEFFQYALRRSSLCSALRRHGFRVLGSRAMSGFWGLWEECPRLAPALDPIGRAVTPAARLVRGGVGALVAPVAGHMLAVWAERPG